jgi:hypothetical protein
MCVKNKKMLFLYENQIIKEIKIFSVQKKLFSSSYQKIFLGWKQNLFLANSLWRMSPANRCDLLI